MERKTKITVLSFIAAALSSLFFSSLFEVWRWFVPVLTFILAFWAWFTVASEGRR